MSAERGRISLRNATEIKVKNLLNLLSCIALAQCCTDFLSRWENIQCPTLFILDTRTDCLSSKNISVAVNVDYLYVECYGADPDRRIFRCFQQTEVINLGMRNCFSRNFNLNEFLSGLVIRSLQIAFTTIEPNYQTLHFEKLPFVRNVSLSGIRTGGSFDLTFDFQPVIYWLQIFKYNFTSFHQPPFKNLTNLPILEIAYGNLQRVQVELLQDLKNLKILNLNNNRLKEIPRGFFKNLTLLTYLDLSDNHIENFWEDIFSDLFSLKVLQIKNNKLTVLPENLLSSLTQLIGLEMSGNTGIKNLPKGFLRGLTRLEHLRASRCSLERLEESLFSDTTFLIECLLDFNNITRLPETLFNNTEHLSRLSMTGNKLSALSPRVFSNLMRIGSLDLSYNRLNNLHKDIFKHLSTLAVLRMSDNDLSFLHEDTLLPLSGLREIDLSNNNFERLPAKYPFGSSNHLISVNISNSNLKTFPNIDWSNNNLTKVDFSHNQFREVTLPVFSKKHTKILLNDNNISTIYIDYRRHSNSYPVYNVTGNVIECDCRIRQFLRFLHFDKNAVRIFPDSNILRCNGCSERKLIEIWPIYSVCPWKEGCPLFCDCYLTLEGQSTIDCSRRSLSDPPASLPVNSTFVNLNNNHIVNLSELNGTTWENVTHLYLSNNSLTSLNDWVVPDNLLYLALDGNKLSDLPPSLMKRVEASSNFSIFLSRNKWKCDCHSVRFKKWFTRNLLKIRDSENVTCQRVNRVSNSVTHELIESIPLDVFCLKEPVWPLWQIIVLTVSVAFVLTSVLVVVCYHYRLAILAFLYSRDVYLSCCYRILDDEEKKYDAFVCYHSSDSVLAMEMVDRLEPTYRLCVHERDWLAGCPISENIVHSVLNSRRTVILLSRQFLDSMWFSVEFRVAYNRMMEDQAYRLVLVLVEELENSKELEDDLRRLLSTRTYLKWGEKWFWEKLKYILPDILGLVDRLHTTRSSCMVQIIFLVQLVFLCTAVQGWFFLTDRFGLISSKMNRRIECGSNVTSYINDYYRTIYVVCRGNTFDAEQIRVCTNFTYFFTVMLRECLLPSSDVGTSLGDKSVRRFFLISEDVPPNSHVIIKNLPNLYYITLHHIENVTYTLLELRNVERIDVLGMTTKKFPNGFFSGLSSLKMICVVLGRIRSFPEDAFRGLNRLKSLYLFNNRLENLPETLFYGLQSLEELGLHRNLLTFLPPAIFRGLTNLNTLTLNDNRLNTLPPSLFADNFNLLYLNASNNSFRSLPEILLQNVSKLEQFDACNCDISELPSKIFSSCYHLIEVRICENRIDRLHLDLFVNNTYIQQIYLHKNRLHELPSTVFSRNKRLAILDLSNNLMTKIPFEVFDDIQNIQALSLTGNRITKVEEGKFEILKNLKVLYLDENPLGSLPESTPFGRLPRLTFLGLSNTSLTQFPRMDWTAYNISLLRLNSNRLSILRTEDLPPDNRSVILLMNNNITTVAGKISRNMNNVTLFGNPFRCDCALRNFVEEVQFLENGRSLLCDSPSDLRNKTFQELIPSYVVCPVVEHCPPKCRCYLYKGFSVIVNCSFSNISHAPAILPENTTIVHLEHNSLSAIKITDSWSGVDELYLDHNRLNPSEHWRFPSSLKFLTLRYNSLQDFPAKFLQYVSDSSYIRVDIRNNAFWCNCSFKPFKLWLNRNVHKIVEAEEPLCNVWEEAEGCPSCLFLFPVALPYVDHSVPDEFLGCHHQNVFEGNVSSTRGDFSSKAISLLVTSVTRMGPCPDEIYVAGATMDQTSAHPSLRFRPCSQYYMEGNPLSGNPLRPLVDEQGDAVMVQIIFLVQLVFLCTAVQGWFFLTDRFGLISSKMNRRIECGSNVTSYINDYYRTIYVVCRGNTFDAEQIRVCTNFTYFFTVMLRECLLPSSDVGTSLGDKSVRRFFLISEDVPPNSHVIIKNLPNLYYITLHHIENVTYTLLELRNVERIDVLGMTTKKFPNGFFSGLSSLKMICVVLGRIRSFPEDAFRGLNRLKSLYLFNNRLENLPETLFYGLQSLEELGLHRNLLTFLPPAIFRGLTNLNTLTLNDNRLNTLPPSLFADNFNLLYLNASNNSFRSLPEILLQNVSKLEQFDACNCDISELPSKIFSSCYHLIEVRICENRIDRLHLDLFVNNTYIQQIYLHKNRLHELPSTVFSRNKRLAILDLSNNLLTKIPFEVFDDIQNIQALSLTGNRITKVEEGKFEILKNLKVLYLDENPLGSLPESTPFGRLPRLTFLGLSNTSLTQFPRMDWTAYNISLLRLNSNRLSILRTEDLPPDNRSVILLMNNNITTVAGKISRNMNNVTLFGNPFRCDCALRNFVEEVQFLENGRSLLCDSPSDLRNKTFQELIPSYVVCPVVEHCPPKCRCYLYKGFSVIVNCSFSNISHAPAILPENTTIVHLEHNSLSAIKITDSWSGVDELYLDHNRLNPSEHWRFPSSLKFLTLRYNSLQDFPAKFLQYVSDSSYIRVDIRNNAFWCNCSFKPFKLWLNRNVHKIVEAEEWTRPAPTPVLDLEPCRQYYMEGNPLSGNPLRPQVDEQDDAVASRYDEVSQPPEDPIGLSLKTHRWYPSQDLESCRGSRFVCPRYPKKAYTLHFVKSPPDVDL
ncbi:uncharacterized protein LOC111641461 [Centruroides sculpturatus]|uniref:uncharacterized protein LOC111641461 n=1 Tax=Centruroides sculpturatus TaxID=218467 RepID=UPI000C6DB47C|nr:uncharacterized protein LOC111641461 [Centruroides sculpturatus]